MKLETPSNNLLENLCSTPVSEFNDNGLQRSSTNINEDKGGNNNGEKRIKLTKSQINFIKRILEEEEILTEDLDDETM